MLANYTDDLVLELPYASPPLRLESKAKVLRFLTGAFKVFRFRIDIGDDVYDLADPESLILEYTSEGSVLTTGKPYCNRYIAIYRFRGDKISHVREYVNPAVTAEATAP
jgi:ketosteroid isomerase-like protein